MGEELGPIGTRVLFENEHVRVWENTLAPGEESPLHRHEHDYLVIDVEGDRLKANPLAGSSYPPTEYEISPELMAIFLEGGTTETAINVGSKRYRTILVELLDSPAPPD